MAKCNVKHLLLFILWSLMTYFCTLAVLQSLREKKLLQEQQDRKQLLREMCDGDQQSFLSNELLHNLLVDDTHGLIYCYIPKVACTNLKRVMVVLKKGEPYEDPLSVTGNVHVLKNLTFLNSFPKNEIKAKLKHYTKFLFVRDPFVRIVSAYRDKFGRYNKPFYMAYGQHIIRLYGNHSDPPQNLDEALALGMRVSFHNFIQYLLDPQTPLNNKHWKQMHRLCQPCLIQYDFIGHQETMQEDVEHLLRILKLQNDIKFPSVRVNVTSPNSMLDWFRSVPLEDREKLYQIYEKDFKLFGYERPDTLLSA